jgi:hypothetical protein
MSNDEVSDMLGDDFDIPELEEDWHPPEEGLRVFGALAQHLRAHPDALANASAVLEDIDDYLAVFEQARTIGAKWRLSVDG